MPEPLPVAAFIAGLKDRGLALRSDGDRIILSGPKESRTDRIRNYLRTEKPALLAYLQSQEQEADPPAEGFPAEIVDRLNKLGFGCAPEGDRWDDSGDTGGQSAIEARIETERQIAQSEIDAAAAVQMEAEDARYAQRIRALNAAAEASLLPVERVELHPGHSTSDPNAYVLTAVRRLRRARLAIPHCGEAKYLDATMIERHSLDMLADWWVEKCENNRQEG